MHPQNIRGVNFSDRHVPPLGCLHNGNGDGEEQAELLTSNSVLCAVGI